MPLMVEEFRALQAQIVSKKYARSSLEELAAEIDHYTALRDSTPWFARWVRDTWSVELNALRFEVTLRAEALRIHTASGDAVVSRLR